MAESTLTGHEAKLIRELKMACLLVEVSVTRHNRRAQERSAQGQGWTLVGRQDGAILLEVHAAFLTAACGNFQKAYYRAAASGIIKGKT